MMKCIELFWGCHEIGDLSCGSAHSPGVGGLVKVIPQQISQQFLNNPCFWSELIHTQQFPTHKILTSNSLSMTMEISSTENFHGHLQIVSSNITLPTMSAQNKDFTKAGMHGCQPAAVSRVTLGCNRVNTLSQDYAHQRRDICTPRNKT